MYVFLLIDEVHIFLQKHKHNPWHRGQPHTEYRFHLSTQSLISGKFSFHPPDENSSICCQTHSTGCIREGQTSLRFVFPSRILCGEPPRQASRVQSAMRPNQISQVQVPTPKYNQMSCPQPIIRENTDLSYDWSNGSPSWSVKAVIQKTDVLAVCRNYAHSPRQAKGECSKGVVKGEKGCRELLSNTADQDQNLERKTTGLGLEKSRLIPYILRVEPYPEEMRFK